MREIVLDTETTGLDPLTGDRLVEIGCVELLNSIPSGNTYHAYINPERDMPVEAFRVHGLSEEFLRDKPKFPEIAQEFLAFISDSNLVIHNAEFDLKFINYELNQIGLDPILKDRVVDTLSIARRKHPGSPNSLDALCSRYRIDNSRRTKHGALLDSEILAEVYIELLGGRQAALVLQQETVEIEEIDVAEYLTARKSIIARNLDTDALQRHEALIDKIGNHAIWRQFTRK